MFLKNIDLHGFKSFTEKTKLQFGPGISVIVGPNGSGKSNVADAVRWVLGEQSARQLRGSKMEDVIFAGTKSRKALGMAEVSIVLDNSDGSLPLEFTEVTVTRRAYRSGEGEYLINQVPCRLKDVHNLFVDTGVGADGFSIIGQGRIDEILNCRPEERRSLIEETAGIVKYRNRKREASRKLNDTEQNLERIRDIIYELANQVDPLAEQAEKARQYQKLKMEADSLEISLAVLNMEEIKVKLDETNAQLAKKQQLLTSLQTEQSQLDAETESIKFSLNQRDEVLAAAQQDLYQLTGNIERGEADINLIQTRQEAGVEQILRLNGELAALQGKTASLARTGSAENQRLQELSAAILLHQEQTKAREGDRREKSERIQSLEAAVERMKNESFDQVQEAARLRNEISSRDQRLQALAAAGEKFAAQSRDFSAYIAGREELAAATVNELREQEARERNDRAALDHLEKALAAGKERLAALDGQAGREKIALDTVRSRADVLKDMQQEYEGYFPGVKAVLNARRKNQAACGDVLGVVAELMQVPEQIRLAVETALGGGLQDLVTRTDQGAKSAIDYLKKSGGGRATFLPLNVVRPASVRDIGPLVQGIEGVLGFAADLVTCTEEVRPAIDFLLKRLLVTRDMEAALKAARACRYAVRIVTLDGDLINPGGALTGGSPQKKTGTLLARIEEIERLTRETGRLELLWQQTAAAREEARREIAGLEQEKEQLLDKCRQLELAAAAARQNQQQLQEAIQAARENLRLVQQEMTDGAREADRMAREREDIANRLLQQEADEQDHARQLSLLQAELKEARENLVQRQDGLTEIKVLLAGMVQEEAALRASLLKLEMEQQELAVQMETKEGEKSAFSQDISAKEVEIQAVKQRTMTLKRQQADDETRLNLLRHERQAEAQLLEEKEKSSREAGRRTIQLQQDLHQVEMKASRWTMEWENNLERLREKFQLTFSQACQQRQELASKKAAGQRIGEIQQAISDLGPVNLSAIDEFQRVNERYQFLTAQESDLRLARESLLQVIGEMDRIMGKRFLETFQAISREFNHTFAHLFGGGLAELRLTQPEEILETGVEIIVQPPGKKVQHHNLLSGGEKALTGIALLFAVLQVKPSPFCILDEIEAALDEANVSRFAEYMRQFSANSQFIVVTHRQGTMEVADVLYGITMEENGVSKTVSVKLAG